MLRSLFALLLITYSLQSFSYIGLSSSNPTPTCQQKLKTCESLRQDAHKDYTDEIEASLEKQVIVSELILKFLESIDKTIIVIKNHSDSKKEEILRLYEMTASIFDQIKVYNKLASNFQKRLIQAKANELNDAYEAKRNSYNDKLAKRKASPGM